MLDRAMNAGRLGPHATEDLTFTLCWTSEFLFLFLFVSFFLLLLPLALRVSCEMTPENLAG